jgi:phosphatidylethanolamine-binding protein (PEBP) family uncharacterized protein
MRRPMKAILCGALPLALALVGCGSSTPTTSPAVSIPFKSPSLVGTAIPARYTCDGRNTFPSLEWGAVPANVTSLAIMLLGLDSQQGNRAKVNVEWAIAGLNPNLHKITSGKVPHGAYEGLTTKGHKPHYSVCPKKGEKRLYRFVIYGVPPEIGVPHNFPAVELLRVLANPAYTYGTRVGGSFPANYTRKA